MKRRQGAHRCWTGLMVLVVGSGPGGLSAAIVAAISVKEGTIRRETPMESIQEELRKRQVRLD